MKFVFDENLSRSLVSGLHGFGENVNYLTEFYKTGTADHIWLKRLGDEGWFAITQDKRLRRRPIENEAIKKYKVGVFVLRGTNMSHWDIILQVIKAWRKIKKYAAETEVPFVYHIDRYGARIEKMPLD